MLFHFIYKIKIDKKYSDYKIIICFLICLQMVFANFDVHNQGNSRFHN